MFTRIYKVGIVVLLGAIIALEVVLIKTPFAKEKSPNQCENFQPYEEQPKDELQLWIDKLETYENCPAEGILDRNSKMSYGALCFQMQTFQQYFKQYYSNRDIEEAEWLNLISDNDLQKDIAYRMISDNPETAWRHWYTSVKRGLGKPPVKTLTSR